MGPVGTSDWRVLALQTNRESVVCIIRQAVEQKKNEHVLNPVFIKHLSVKLMCFITTRRPSTKSFRHFNKIYIMTYKNLIKRQGRREKKDRHVKLIDSHVHFNRVIYIFSHTGSTIWQIAALYLINRRSRQGRAEQRAEIKPRRKASVNVVEKGRREAERKGQRR